MADKKNAMAALAEWMAVQVDAFPVMANQFAEQDERDKANAQKIQRIVAEMAKYGDVMPPLLNMKSVFEKCRAIAEEGV